MFKDKKDEWSDWYTFDLEDQALNYHPHLMNKVNRKFLKKSNSISLIYYFDLELQKSYFKDGKLFFNKKFLSIEDEEESKEQYNPKF